MSTSEPVVSNKSSVQLLQEINSGQTDPNLFDKASRQRCIELLIAEGYTYSHIAQVLKCSEKTVSRDLKEIRTRNELTPSLLFAKQFIGDVFKKAMNHHAYLMRIARMKNVSPFDKIQAESAAWRVLKDLLEKFQSLGYLPLRPQEIVGDVFHHLDGENEKSLGEIKKMVVELEEVHQEAGDGDKVLSAEIGKLKKRIEQAELATEVTKLAEKQKEENKKKEDENV